MKKHTLELAMIAKSLYLYGLERIEIAKLYNKTISQIDRYFRSIGGLTRDEITEHRNNRLLRYRQ